MEHSLLGQLLTDWLSGTRLRLSYQLAKSFIKPHLIIQWSRTGLSWHLTIFNLFLLFAELWVMVLSKGHILEPVWVGGTISSLTVDQSGVRNPRGPYRAWWSPGMDKCTTFSWQWFSNCTFSKLEILASGQSFNEILPGVFGKICKILCQGQFMHNKSGVWSPQGPCGAWWSPPWWQGQVYSDEVKGPLAA